VPTVPDQIVQKWQIAGPDSPLRFIHDVVEWSVRGGASLFLGVRAFFFLMTASFYLSIVFLVSWYSVAPPGFGRIFLLVICCSFS
jgi:hypothetical protein